MGKRRRRSERRDAARRSPVDPKAERLAAAEMFAATGDLLHVEAWEVIATLVGKYGSPEGVPAVLVGLTVRPNYSEERRRVDLVISPEDARRLLADVTHAAKLARGSDPRDWTAIG